MPSLFDLLGVETKKDRQQREFAERGLAIREEQAQLAQQQFQQQQQLAQEQRFRNMLADPQVPERNKQVIAQALGQLPQYKGLTEQLTQQRVGEFQESFVPKLFQELGSGQLPLKDAPEAIMTAGKVAGVTEPVSLFDFTKPKVETVGKPIEGTFYQRDPVTGAIKILQQPPTAKTAMPMTQTDILDKFRSIDAAVAKGDMTRDAANAQKEGIWKSNPNLVAGLNKDAMFGSPQVKASATNPNQVIVNVDTGEKTIPVEKTVRNKIQDDIINLNKTISSLDELEQQFEKEFLTVPGAMRAGVSEKAEKWLGIPPKYTEKMLAKAGLVEEEDPEFLARRTDFLLPAFTMLNEKIKEITGVAVRPGEEGRLGASTVDPTRDSPTQFMQKVKTVRRIADRQRKEKLILLVRGLPYNAENIKSIPIGSIDEIYRKEVAGQELTPTEEVKVKVNEVKNAGEQGKATIANTPTTQTTPKTMRDKIKFGDFSDFVTPALPEGSKFDATSLLQSHPNAMDMIMQAKQNNKVNQKSLSVILGWIKEYGYSDDELYTALKRTLGIKDE